MTSTKKDNKKAMKKPILTEVYSLEDYAKQELESYALPEVCNRVRCLLDADEASLAEISRVVVFDPSVSSEIMKLANSPIFNFKQKIDSLSRAVVVLGGERIYSMLLAQFTMTTFNDLHSNNLDMKRFWLNSFCTAFIAQDLAKAYRLSTQAQEKLYLCGLMHNVGELAVAKLSPKSAILCEKLVRKGVHPWLAQREQLGFSYVDCSIKMLENWHLPQDLLSPMRTMTSDKPCEIDQQSRILNIAANCALAMVTEGHFNIDDFLANKFSGLSTREINIIHSSKRNAIDRSSSVVDLMDGFDTESYFRDSE